MKNGIKTALITGITGQDGSYLAELLLGRGYRVIGAVRVDQHAGNVMPSLLSRGVKLVEWDMMDQIRMSSVLKEYQPLEIYNLAANSSGIGMYEDPVGMAEVNGISVARILESIRKVDVKIRFCQASSREIFGEPIVSPQSESTRCNPRSPYGAAKLYADSMIRIYRQRYGIFACSAILFNHESPRRSLEFVTRKIAYGAASIKLGLAKELLLGNLESQRDWGFAGDYVQAMWLMLQQPCADDYVIATGKAHSVKQFCDISFSHLGLNYRDYVREDITAYRYSESAPLVGSAKKANQKLGWYPKTSFEKLVHMMVEAEFNNNKSHLDS